MTPVRRISPLGRAGKTFLALPGNERLLLVKALVVLTAVVAALRWRGLSRTLDWFSGPVQSATNCVRNDNERHFSRICLAVDRVARVTGLGTCLGRAIAARYLLGRGGVPVVLRIGVRRPAVGLEAHAWVELDAARLRESGEVAGKGVSLVNMTQRIPAEVRG